MERQLNQITGTERPLCDRFDLIGGTSTGAILAAGLCLGLKAADLRDFYLKFGKEIFSKVFFPVRFWHSYPSAPLERHLKEVFGEATKLGSDKLRTSILIVSKNATLGSTWFFTNNPKSRYFANNAGLPLWQVVRASTAAPTYFPPQPIAVPDDRGQPQNYEFIDGGVSSYNNPSLQVFLEATEPSYQFGFPTGSDKLLLLSLGTGYNPVTVSAGAAARFNLLDWARYSVKELLNDANLQQNVLMHLIGERPQPPTRAAADAADAALAAGGAPRNDALEFMKANLGAAKLLSYQRITVSITRARLDGLGLSDVDPAKVREMDAADQIGNMRRLGQAVANEQVHMETWRRFFV